jgi:hypothetical protein
MPSSRSWHWRDDDLHEILEVGGRTDVRFGRFFFGITSILPMEAQWTRHFEAEPPQVLLLNAQYILPVPVVAEQDDAGLALSDLPNRLLAERREPVLDPAQPLIESLIDAVDLAPTDGPEKDDTQWD